MKKNEKKAELNVKDVGVRLKAVREALEMTIDNVAALVGFAKSNVSLVENGYQKPSLRYLYALFEHHGVNLNYIFSGEGEMFLEKPPEDIMQAVKDMNPFAEMQFMIDNLDMVRFAMVSHYISFRTQNKNIIKQLIEEKEIQEQNERSRINKSSKETAEKK